MKSDYLSIIQIIKKYNKQKLILLLLILFISAAANIIETHYLTLIFVFLYTIRLFAKRYLTVQLSIIIFLIVYLFSLVVYYFTFGWLDTLLSIRMLLIFIMGYLAVRILQDNLLILYEKVIYVLAIISLILFPLQIVYYDGLYSFMDSIQKIVPFIKFTNGVGANIIIYSIDSGAQTRNSGFAWEPKGFGNFLIIAIVVNLVQNRFKINRKLIVFIITTLTTFSTTAYICLFFLIPAFYIVNMHRSYIYLFIPISILAMFIILRLDFMQNKMEREWNNRYEYQTLLSDSRSYEARSLGRMPSMLVDLMDFEKKPIWGYGMQRSERQQSIYTHLVRVNGLTDWLASFGIIGISFLILSHYAGFKKYLVYNNLKGQFILVLIILVIYFASNVMRHPFWTMLLFLFVSDQPTKKISKNPIAAY